MAQAPTRVLGWAALACYAVHAAELLTRFPAVDLLWTCNVAALVVAAGLLAGAPRPVAIACTMLAIGDVVWLVDLSTGGELLLTSLLTHFGSLLLGLVGLRRTGLPRQVWWQSIATIAVVTLAARFAGHPEENVNLAHRIPPGWERPFPSHAAYLAALAASFVAGALAFDAVLRAAGWRERGYSIGSAFAPRKITRAS